MTEDKEGHLIKHINDIIEVNLNIIFFPLNVKTSETWF